MNRHHINHPRVTATAAQRAEGSIKRVVTYTVPGGGRAALDSPGPLVQQRIAPRQQEASKWD